MHTYRQIGRGRRQSPATGKTHCLFLDFTVNVEARRGVCFYPRLMDDMLIERDWEWCGDKPDSDAYLSPEAQA